MRDWAEVTRGAAELTEHVLRTRPAAVAVTVTSGFSLVTALVAARGMECGTVITGPGTTDAALTRLGVDVRVDPADPSLPVRRLPGETGRMPEPGEPGVWLLSSGTTGEPKPAFWPWRRLDTGRWGQGCEHWGLGYAPHSFAAVTATCQALGRAAVVEFVRPADLASPPSDAATLTVAAATPSFWRKAAIATQDSRTFRRVETVTIGGEPIDASLLRLVHETVAPKRIKQIFGTTEFGTVIQVNDGLPGLPESMNGRRLPGGTAFEVRGDRLWVSAAPESPYVDTGDLVRVADGRVHIAGRTGVSVNVGGMKANPYRGAEVLQLHESVLAARAYGVRSPLLGQVVAADVVVRGDAVPRLLIPELKRFTADHLEAHERPRRISVVADLAVAASGKVQL